MKVVFKGCLICIEGVDRGGGVDREGVSSRPDPVPLSLWFKGLF